jgi:folate-binding protein YgfZ
MHPDWRIFLQRQGAVFAADRVQHLGRSQAELREATHAAVMADLSGSDGLIAVEGADSRGFLQGQLSTSVPALTPALSQFSSWNNAKGRVVTTLRVFERGDHLLLSLPGALLAKVLKRLSMYLLRAQVKLMNASDALTAFGLAGDQSAGMLAAFGLAVPAEINAVTSNQGIQLIRLHGTTPRFAVYADAAQLQPLWTELEKQGARPVGSDAWTLLRILAGEPSVHPETSEHFVAQMLGLEELGAIHFNKGCYLGQEVIARAHYRGAIKRHLHRAQCHAVGPLPPGTAIQVGGDDQVAGEVADACRDANGVWQMLIVLQDAAVNAPLKINDAPVHLMPSG